MTFRPTFEYRDTDRDILTAQPDIDDDRKPVVYIETPSNGVYVPLDRVEEVVAGIRDAARQASGLPPTVEATRAVLATPCAYCGHTYNWHTILDGCKVTAGENGCGCTTFVTPAAVRQASGQQPDTEEQCHDCEHPRTLHNQRGCNGHWGPEEGCTCHYTHIGATACKGSTVCGDNDEPCDQHEREQAHAEGEHAFCGDECICTCDSAGPEFVPAGHYRDCPQYAPAPAAGLSDTQPTVDRAAVRERVRLAIAKQWLDETGSGRTVDELDDFEFGTLADAALAATPVGRCASSHCVEGDHVLIVEEDETR